MADTQQAPKSLFQQIQGNLSKMAAPQSAGLGVLGSTRDVQAISQAATGKAGPAEGMEGPQRDVQQELAVVDQVKQGQQAIARDSQLTQLAQQQADQQIQNEASFSERKLDEEELNKLDQFHQIQQRILTDYTTGQRQLDFNRDKARLEQLGFASRLSNDKYLNDLQRQANKARLSDAARFEEEMVRTVFADEEVLLRDSLDFRAMMAADSRQFTEATAQIDLDFAMSLANAENRTANEKSFWQGISGLVSSGAEFATSKTGSDWLKSLGDSDSSDSSLSASDGSYVRT